MVFTTKNLVREHKVELHKLNQKHEFEIDELRQQNSMNLREKDFELKHFKDDTVKELRSTIKILQETNAVLEKENEMLDKITNLNADIIDIKELVNKLISKLPTIDIKGLSATSNSGGNNNN